jgi:hypothetical protein
MFTDGGLPPRYVLFFGGFIMKKKIVACLLVIGMSVSLSACGTNDAAQENNNSEVISETESETETESESETEKETGAGESTGADDLGQALYESFAALDEANPDAGATELAEGLLANDFILFSGATMEVEPGYLTGFGNAEITGFEEGTMFAPMIGSIPFVGYVFCLADEADAESFKAVLADNADPNWNICTQADETVIESIGNKVFFVMCPTTLEDE